MTEPYRHVALDNVRSTNDEAVKLLRAGDPGDFVVTAREQSGGRGRQGRLWASPPGNLYMSLALRDPAPLEIAPQLGFVAGVALVEALRARLGGDASLMLKWPNDILHAGAKLAGMLLEGVGLPSGGIGVVIGIGVNCRSHPGNLAYAATDLVEAGDHDASPLAVLAEFTRRFDIQKRIWNEGTGFPAIRRSWLGLAAGLGEQISVATSRCRHDGTFRDLDANGRLLLDTTDGMIVIEAGDVFFPALVAERTH